MAYAPLLPLRALRAFVQTLVLGVVVATASQGAIPSFDDDFESYTEGLNFVAATNGWQASGADVIVTNGSGYQNSKAVFMGETVALTNSLIANTPHKVWTDFRIRPMLGVEVTSPPTNRASIMGYFNASGVVCVASASGWLICSNDIWGNPVAPLADTAYARISVFQDYSRSNQAVFLNDQLILQDVSFVGPAGAYNQLVFRNPSSNCWVDNVWIHTNVVGLASNRNHDAESLGDAAEVEQYGYARRVLYVGGAGTPRYVSFQAAVNAWRLRDSIYVYAGTYAESVTITNNAVFEGQAFAVNNLTISAGASVTFPQSVNCLSVLAVTGQVAMASGASLTSATAQVVGTLSVSGAGAFVVTNLNVGAAGLVAFTNAQLVANAGAVALNGTFVISNTWSTAASMPLPFSDDFELYATNTALRDLNFKGWYASAGTVKIQSAVAHAGKAVVLPDGTVLSNKINSAVTKVWTDYYVQPSLGLEPSQLPTNTSSFLGYVNTNGFLVVATAGGGWGVCSNQLNNTLAAPFQNNAFTRVSICQDLSVSPNKFAVFVAGNLVAQGLSSPVSLSRYSSFATDNRDGTAYIDDVRITTAIPSGLTSDLDGNGLSDAYEINNCGATSQFYPHGTVYKFR